MYKYWLKMSKRVSALAPTLHWKSWERKKWLVTRTQAGVFYVREGWIGGAILDVFNQEPLPADSELWSLPGVVITPHCSGPSRPDRVNILCYCYVAIHLRMELVVGVMIKTVCQDQQTFIWQHVEWESNLKSRFGGWSSSFIVCWAHCPTWWVWSSPG